ncbi:MAG: cell division ATP-binding protein FtsE [Patescibacteria group bacterium]|nr:cell division ATP-binding protein FtsE [Patescibacteria group bacterium]
MISFEKVARKFGPITALEEITFSIEKGEFVFLTGPSGAGKSTLIKLILGEYLPSGGEIAINGEKISKIPRRKLYLWRRKLGVVFQDYKLLWDKTVWENIALPLQIRHLSTLEINSRIEKMLALIGLSDRGNLFPAQLAGGELQRTALARAVITAPEILLADEPTGNLDPKTSLEMMKLFKEINRSGTTVLMATHNAEIVDSLKARVIELSKGKIIRDEKEGKYCRHEDKKDD